MKIQISKKFDSEKFDSNVKLRDIADQLTLVLYGQKLNACLGHAMNIRKNSISDKKIDVCVPEVVWRTANHTDVRYDKDWHVKRSTLQMYIRNVIAHAKKNDLDVKLQNQ